MADPVIKQWPRIFLIYALGVLAVGIISVAVPEIGGIAREFHPRSPAALGWVISMPALVAALGALMVGALVDAVGDREILITGGLFLVAGEAGAALTTSLSSLLAWRIIGGIGYVGMAVSAVTLLTRLTAGRQRTAALALWSTVIPASFILAFLVGAILLAPGQWRLMFGLHAAGALTLLACGTAYVPKRPVGQVRVSRLTGLGTVVRSHWPYVLGLSFAANAFMQTGVIAGLPHMLSASLGVSEGKVGSFNIVAMLFNMAGAFGVGALLNRGVRAPTVGFVGVLLCGLACAGLALAPTGFAPAMAMNSAFMLGCGMLVGLWALLPRVAPSLQTLGATSGLVTQITLVGVLFGPPAALYSLSRGTAGFLIFIGISLAGSLVGLPVWLKATGSVSLRNAPGVMLEGH